jgi:uncharacterized protein (DUF983 family)
MIKVFLRGLMLRCPNCGQGHLSDSLFSMRRDCEVCHVVYERKSGESAGASIIMLSILPILALISYFVIDFLNPGVNPWLAGGVPMAIMILIGIFFYRNARGLWIAATYLTGGVYADGEKK